MAKTKSSKPANGASPKTVSGVPIIWGPGLMVPPSDPHTTVIQVFSTNQDGGMAVNGGIAFPAAHIPWLVSHLNGILARAAEAKSTEPPSAGGA